MYIQFWNKVSPTSIILSHHYLQQYHIKAQEQSISKKPSVQAAGTDPSQCNFTTMQNYADLVKLP